jgi:NTE family protein
MEQNIMIMSVTELDKHTQITNALAKVAIFAKLSIEALQHLAHVAVSLQLSTGDPLYHKGDPPLYVYIVWHGRLRVSLNERTVGYVGRYQPIGEMAVIVGEERNTTVHAVRDTLLLKFTAQVFLDFVQTNAASLLDLTRLVIQRGRNAYNQNPQNKQTYSGGTLAVIPASSGVSAIQLAEALNDHLYGWPATRLITSAHVESVFGKNFAQTPLDKSPEDLRLRTWLASLEEHHKYVLYAADNDSDQWSLRCLHQADRILILAEAARLPEPVPVLDALHEKGLIVPIELVLLRSEGDPSPHTLAWRDETQARAHYFIHPWAHADISALARQISGTGVGLVLGGGGARGFAHIGLIRALEQLQIPIDVVGGTSMGAFIAALVACGFDSVEMTHIVHETFVARNYLNDYTVPKVSLIRGARFHNRLHAIFGTRRIEELRRTFYCISTNLTTGSPMIHDRGTLATWVGTSMSVPGVVPPVAWHGDLLCDGGVVNNLPTDVMHGLERGIVIASNVSMNGDIGAPGAGEDEPDQMALLNWKGIKRAPKLSEILMRTATLASDTTIQLASISNADIYLRMPIADIGMFDWHRLDELIERGYQYGLEVLTPLRESLPDSSWVRLSKK